MKEKVVVRWWNDNAFCGGCKVESVAEIKELLRFWVYKDIIEMIHKHQKRSPKIDYLDDIKKAGLVSPHYINGIVLKN